jgi:ketosteroid isomerase-like protein
MHPDQARHEADREKRTQLMKEATRAYEEGDLARLLELETAWQNERAVAETADSLARCRELERVNRELLKQVRELTRELRDAKREAREEARGLLPAELIEQATSELDALQQICDWVQRFRDGKLTLNELLERCY